MERYALYFLGLLWGNWGFLAQGQVDSLPTPPERYVMDITDILTPENAQKTQVVAASRSAKFADDIPVTVRVIRREEILKNGYVTLVDILKTVPGIKVSQPGSAERGEMFLMRGLIGNEYTKILINNLPVQPSVIGGIPISAQLPIRQAERIEIIYGPAAAVYGADALAGVINIITHQPDKSNYAQGDIQLGQGGYRYLNFKVGGKTGKDDNILYYNLYGNSLDHRALDIQEGYSEVYDPANSLRLPLQGLDDPSMSIDEVLLPYYEGTSTAPAMDEMPRASRALGVQLKYKGWRFSFDQMYRRDHASLGKSTLTYAYNVPLTFIGENIQRATLAYEGGSTRLHSTTQVSYLRYRMDRNSSLGVNYREERRSYIYEASDDLYFEQLLTFTPNRKWEFVSGFTFQFSGNLPRTNELLAPFDESNYRSYRTAMIPEHPLYGDFGYNPITYSQSALFVQAYYLAKRWTLMGGLRYDRGSQFDENLNPRLGILYKLSQKTQLKASLGRAFRAPAPSFTYVSTALPAGSSLDSILYVQVPQLQLQPERYFSIESGITHQLGKSVSVELEGYFNQIENPISAANAPVNSELYPLSVNDRARSYGNSRNAKINLWGVQLIVNAQDLLQPLGLGADFSLTYSEGNEILPNQESFARSGDQIDEVRMTPTWMGQLGLQFNPGTKWYIRLQHTLMSSWINRFAPSFGLVNNPLFQTEGYYTLDTRIHYQIGPQLSAYCQIDNVFNETYGGIGATGLDIDLPLNPQQRRNIRFGLMVKLE